MASVEVNYFTCTLGHSLQRKQQGLEPATSVATILELLEDQARTIPRSPALGFANFKARGPANNVPDVVTFKELRDLSVSAAKQLLRFVEPAAGDGSESVVALLCRSSMDFVLTWLGLMHLGYATLLLAPQVEPPAIQHLCSILKANTIFVDDTHADRASAVGDGIKVLKVPYFWDTDLPLSTAESPPRHQAPQTAFICHTSGTSSGLPKPIPQTQFGVCGALPHFPGNDKPATFSTTPLYHGGLADTCRAWTSGAMIWFFPEGVAPITGTNLVSAITFAHQQSTVPVKYFSSVPYILQMLAEEEEGMRLLQDMDLVGVGGAALPSAAGDKLVQAGVNLLSRMGSAECGFLMSSHRDYPHDREWQYLRPADMPGLLSFEPRDGGLSELIVKPNWPFKIKTNCEDGSYATADLFEPHPSIPNAWRYHSRADAQIALANGKKFDPSPMEASILASTSLLRDVLIFGAGRDYPGILLFPTDKETSEKDAIASVWPIIESMNSSTQSHARLSKSMLIVVSLKDGEQPLEKSSKGTILRRQAEEKYSKEIDSAYDSSSSLFGASGPVSDGQLPSVVQDCFARILGRDIDPNRDLYEQGVDSISCIKIRKLVESACLPEEQRPLPLNIIYDQGTVSALCVHLSSLRSGMHESGRPEDNAELKRMEELAKKYSDFQDVHVRSRRERSNVIVLTGATGLLGAHILHLLRQDNHTKRVYCLLRAKTPEEANQRVHKALITRELPGLGDASGEKNFEIIALPCDFSRENLGLSEAYQSRLQEEATTFIHAAWTVNFTLRLGSFENQVAGTRYLIDMALAAGANLVFISSIAAVSSSSAATIPEALSNDPAEASPLGYSQSKWVTEKVCASANQWVGRSLLEENERPSVSVIRVGQLCGNQMGVWNTSEAYPLMLSTASITGCMPDLPQETLNWLPVELAAQAVLDLSRVAEANETNESRITETQVYHVLNPHDTPTWKDSLQWIKEKNEKPQFDIVSPTDWVRRLEEVVTEKAPNHPSQALLSMWKSRYYKQPKDDSGKDASPATPVFEIRMSKEVSTTMREVSPVEPERLSKIWRWVHQNIVT